jgi:hypothetical protein
VLLVLFSGSSSAARSGRAARLAEKLHKANVSDDSLLQESTSPTLTTASIVHRPPEHAAGVYPLEGAFERLQTEWWYAPDRQSTQYANGGDPTFYFILDFGQPFDVQQMIIRNCGQTCGSYWVGNFELYVSDDLNNWGDAVTGQLRTQNNIEQPFAVAKLGRYVKFVALTYGPNSAALSFIGFDSTPYVPLTAADFAVTGFTLIPGYTCTHPASELRRTTVATDNFSDDMCYIGCVNKDTGVVSPSCVDSCYLRNPHPGTFALPQACANECSSDPECVAFEITFDAGQNCLLRKADVCAEANLSCFFNECEGRMWQRWQWRVSASAVGDPHFHGFDGSQYDFQGEPGNWFNIITDSDFQLNALFVESPTDGKTYMGEIAVQVQNVKILVIPHKVKADSIILPDGIFHLESHEKLGVVRVVGLRTEIQTPAFHLKIDNVKNKDHTFSYLNMDSVSATSDELHHPHGILGQTASFLVNGAQPNPVTVPHQNKNAKGFIEGRPTDYLVLDGRWGTQFSFNRFGEKDNAPKRATKVRKFAFGKAVYNEA